MKGIPMKDIFEQCHNPPLRMHGRADGEVIDQPGCMGEQMTESSTSRRCSNATLRCGATSV